MFSVVSLLLDANSWKFKKPFRLEFPPMFSCQKLSQFFPIVFFGKVALFPSEQKNFQVENSGKFQISNDCNQIMGVEKYPWRIFGGSWPAKEKKNTKPPGDVALTQLEVFQFFCWPHLLGRKSLPWKERKRCMKKSPLQLWAIRKDY